jgi:hypothetical protein
MTVLRRPDLTGGEGPAVAAAVKALNEGNARSDQQKIVLNFIIDILAATYELSYRPENNALDTAFAEGRRYVGLELRRIIATPHAVLTTPPEKPSMKKPNVNWKV